MAAGQVALASMDLTLAARVLFVLLPSDPSLSFLHLFSIYLLAVVAGVASQVPGGLGVFDLADQTKCLSGTLFF